MRMDNIADRMRELRNEIEPVKVNKQGRTEAQERALNAQILKYVTKKRKI